MPRWPCSTTVEFTDPRAGDLSRRGWFLPLGLEDHPLRPQVDHPRRSDPGFLTPALVDVAAERQARAPALDRAEHRFAAEVLAAAANVDVTARRRVNREHAPFGTRFQHLGGRLLGEVEAPVPGGHRDARAEAEEA